MSFSFPCFTFDPGSFLWGIIGPLGCVAWYCFLRVIAFVFCFFVIAPCRGMMLFHAFITSCVLGCISRLLVVAFLTSVGFGVAAGVLCVVLPDMVAFVWCCFPLRCLRSRVVSSGLFCFVSLLTSWLLLCLSVLFFLVVFPLRTIVSVGRVVRVCGVAAVGASIFSSVSGSMAEVKLNPLV